ncbi:hypothetical protein [Paenibacillus lutimineralis]|uniref:Uncharacterized protein n=1 Tax=Paenibacillus lutimineralis TaxID=2707005 RepID=A0A3Q9I7V4_9BACL|nr:hypothetical protein [Paenibacillus lutimineralis]AZS14677.1 hypothetical protein EI981_09560 [Paenibacillus lutimineralis]
MKICTYPNTIGAARVALIGASAAGKSSLAKRVLPPAVVHAAKIVGKPSAQTTPIPIHYFLQQGYSQTRPKLRITLQSFQKDSFQVNTDAIFTAIQYVLLNFVKGSPPGAGVPFSALKTHINSEKFIEAIHSEVNGAVRLERLHSSEFSNRIRACAQELLEEIIIAEIDSAMASMKSDTEKSQAKQLAFTNQLRRVWDDGLKNEDSNVFHFASYMEKAMWDKLVKIVPFINTLNHGATCEFDLSNVEDNQHFSQLLDPYEPFSLIIEKYEVSCGLSEQFEKVLMAIKKKEGWPEKLPFRMVLVDTVGLTQDSQSSEDISRRLKAAINNDCDGILLMLPPTLRDGEMRTMERLFSSKSEEWRQIQRNNIKVYIGLSRADEEVAPQFDIDSDKDSFVKEMNSIFDHLKKKEQAVKESFQAVKAKCITNQPRKIKQYLTDLIDLEQDELTELAHQFEEMLGEQSSLVFLFQMATALQKQHFPSEKPIFFKATSIAEDGLHIKLNPVESDSVSQMARAIHETSQSYVVENWLHWNTAYAVRDSVRYGTKFVSRAIQHGRISIYIDGDLRNAAARFQWKFKPAAPNDVFVSHIDLSSPESASLLDELDLSLDQANEDLVKTKLLEKLFIKNFTGDYEWRFWRAMSRVIRRLSYTDPIIKEELESRFNRGNQLHDPSYGVECMLQYYQGLYQSPKFQKKIEEVLNEELSREFNKFFFAIY